MERLNICKGQVHCIGATQGGVGQGGIPFSGQAPPYSDLTPQLSNRHQSIARGSASGLDRLGRSQPYEADGAPRIRSFLSQASSCHLRKIKIRPLGDKACCARDRHSSDSLPEVINPRGKMCQISPGICPPAASHSSSAQACPGRELSLEGFWRKKPGVEVGRGPTAGCAGHRAPGTGRKVLCPEVSIPRPGAGREVIPGHVAARGH
jgi:hypothetical protein